MTEITDFDSVWLKPDSRGLFGLLFANTFQKLGINNASWVAVGAGSLSKLNGLGRVVIIVRITTVRVLLNVVTTSCLLLISVQVYGFMVSSPVNLASGSYETLSFIAGIQSRICPSFRLIIFFK